MWKCGGGGEIFCREKIQNLVNSRMFEGCRKNDQNKTMK